MRGDDIAGEGAEGVAHHVHVVTEVQRTRPVGERRDELRIPVVGDEAVRRFESAGRHTPERLPAEDLGRQVVEDVGGEGAGDGGLGRTLRPVVEKGTGSGQGRRGMGDVVGEDLVDIRAAEFAESADGRPDDRVAEVDHGGGGQHVGLRDGAHLRELTVG